MKTSSATKRRRRRERRFMDWCDVLSVRTATIAAVATGGFLVLKVVRTFLPA